MLSGWNEGTGKVRDRFLDILPILRAESGHAWLKQCV